MALKIDPERLRANVLKATTEDLLDRATVYRAGMEPEALTIIEEELANRGVDRQQIWECAERMEEEVVRNPDGTAAKCSFCRKPAVLHTWGWHWLWKLVPLFPRPFFYCIDHQPGRGGVSDC